MSSHFPGSRASVHVAVALDEKQCDNKCPWLPSLSFYCWANIVYNTLQSIWASCPAYVPSWDLSHPLPTGGVGEHWKARAVQPKHCCVISTFLAPKTKHRTVRAPMGKINSILARYYTGFVSVPVKLIMPGMNLSVWGQVTQNGLCPQC